MQNKSRSIYINSEKAAQYAPPLKRQSIKGTESLR